MAAGRPRLEFDVDEFEKLCALQCTQAEIANHFSMSVDTVDRRVKEIYGKNFAEIFAEKRLRGLVSLRSKQYQVAMSGNVKMLDKLGDAWLGQSKRIDHTGSLKSDSKLVINLGAADDNETSSGTNS